MKTLKPGDYCIVTQDDEETPGLIIGDSWGRLIVVNPIGYTEDALELVVNPPDVKPTKKVFVSLRKATLKYLEEVAGLTGSNGLSYVGVHSNLIIEAGLQNSGPKERFEKQCGFPKGPNDEKGCGK